MSETKHNSHDLAAALRKIAEKMEAAPAFNFGAYSKPFMWINFSTEKAEFIAAAKAIGGKKRQTEHEYKLETELPALSLCLSVERSAVCRLVKPAQPAVYDCEPLLTAEEEAEIALGKAEIA